MSEDENLTLIRARGIFKAPFFPDVFKDAGEFVVEIRPPLSNGDIVVVHPSDDERGGFLEGRSRLSYADALDQLLRRRGATLRGGA